MYGLGNPPYAVQRQGRREDTPQQGHLLLFGDRGLHRDTIFGDGLSMSLRIRTDENRGYTNISITPI